MTRPYCVLVCCMIPYKFKGAGVPVSCILALCVGESCHCTLYHNLARLTIYGTTAKWPIYVSGHWYIFNCIRGSHKMKGTAHALTCIDSLPTVIRREINRLGGKYI